MAKPIKDTPILKGNDAKEFSKKIASNENKKVSSSEYQRMLGNYKKFTLK